MKKTQACARIVGHAIEVTALGRFWTLDYSQNLEELWDNMDAADMTDERIPYWAELWPASLALVEWLAARKDDIGAGVCVDLGCGMGFTAIVARWLGANVLACDYFPEALRSASHNARLNGIDPAPQWLALDWRKPALRKGGARWLWASDILYESRAMPPVLEFMAHVLAPGGEAWLAEPGRGVFTPFLELAGELGWQMDAAAKREVAPVCPDGIPSRVTIWRAKRR